MFPCPGFVLLVIGERLNGADQHSRSAGRPQAGVHLIQNAGGGAGAEQMHHPLRQPQVELPAVDAAIAVGHHLRRAIQQEYQIEIGTVTQLPAAQLAVADHRKAAPVALLQMGRLAVARHHVARACCTTASMIASAR